MKAIGLQLPQPIPYPERRLTRESVWDGVEAAGRAVLLARTTRRRGRGLDAVMQAAKGQAEALRTQTDIALREQADALRFALRAAPLWPAPLLGQALAVVREAGSRALGLYAFESQLLAAAAVLRGRAAEMATGEGKTLAAMLAAAVAGLAGVPVHLVTVNAYLAERDAAAGAPLYHFLGLTVGLVTDTIEREQRRAAYRCDVTVCTSKDLAFDYMRDRVAAGGRIGALRLKAARLSGLNQGVAAPLLRGLHFAILDEVDSILIDEARTPLILAAADDDQAELVVTDQALATARALRPGLDYAVLQAERRVMLLVPGRAAIPALVPQTAPWDEPAERNRLTELALTALHTLHRGEHYVIQDGKAELVDEYTGRIMPDRSWSDGLQAMVERKEGLTLSARHVTRARMTYQRFFRRYRRLAGMSGTLHEVAGELWRTFRLRVTTIPRHRPDRRVTRSPLMFFDAEAKWRAIVADVSAIHASGAPVLIGTRTVSSSEQASAALTARTLPHVVLSATNNAQEAVIIERAGRAGAITVATNMAGRGTDIRIDAAALAAGGLHVFLSEPHEARRIDRQLGGRCGRQGDPGTVLRYGARDDALVVRHGLPAWLPGWLAPRFVAARFIAANFISASAQRRAERLHARMRRELLHSDEWLGDAVAFAGEEE